MASRLSASLLSPTAAAGVLAVVTTGLGTPRVLLAPAGTRLPRGVYAVVAAPAPAPAPVLASAAGPGRRRATLIGAAGADDTPTGDTTNDNDDTSFDRYIEEKAVQALDMLAGLIMPEHLLSEAGDVEGNLQGVLAAAKAGDRKKAVLELIGSAYHLVDLAQACLPTFGGAPPPFVIKVRAASPAPEGSPSIVLKDGSVLWFDFGAEQDDTEAMKRAVNIHIVLALGITTYLATYHSLE